MNFMKMLENAWKESGSPVCVGLDPDLKKIPAHLRSEKNPLFQFNRAIIDATANLVCCYKPQIAYYAGQSADEDLLLTMRYLKKNYPEVPVILDAKRADIGATSTMYVSEAFVRFEADAVTVNPYMGMDAIKPFLDYADKGVVILCRTSNPGAKEIQEVKTEKGEELYKWVARLASSTWNYNGNVMLVAGATFPAELGQIRSIVGNVPLLVPGVGAQGGDVEQVVKHGLAPNGEGLVINSSRGIIYASNGPDFAEAAAKAALTLKNTINQFRK